MKWLKKQVWNLLNLSYLGGLVQLRLKSGLLEDGWFLSFKTKRSVNAKGEPIPWCTYPFIKFIETRLTKDLIAFEYGSGGGTAWYAARINMVIAVEHDKAWIEEMRPKLPSNTRVCFRERSDPKGYAEEIKNHSYSFDVVINDGVHRNECVTASIPCLSEKGVIIYDNSDRPEYAPSLNELKQAGFKRLDFWGLSPVTGHTCCTSVFYRNNNCLGL